MPRAIPLSMNKLIDRGYKTKTDRRYAVVLPAATEFGAVSVDVTDIAPGNYIGNDVVKFQTIARGEAWVPKGSPVHVAYYYISTVAVHSHFAANALVSE